MITVFTPTYNRARLLPRLHQSLCRQTYTDFEWLIVDDGSTDETAELFESLHNAQCIIHTEEAPSSYDMLPASPSELEGEVNSSTPFRGLGGLHYIQQPNGGKHRAINRGIKEAQGELFFIVDSDDWLPDDALQNIAEMYETVKDNPAFAGVSGHRGYPNGRIVGSGQQEEFIDANALDIRYQHHVTGDLNEVFLTSVMHEYYFPEYDGEKFCPEALVWNRIAQKYKLRYFNRITYIADYQPGGLTDRIVRVRMESPMASTTCYREMLAHDIPLKEKVKASINYWRFRLCSNRPQGMPRLPLVWNLFMPIGWVMHHRDKSRYGEKSDENRG